MIGFYTVNYILATVKNSSNEKPSHLSMDRGSETEINVILGKTNSKGESKSAMMYFTNTAKNTNTEASGGGGSIGGLGVLGLLSLAWLRQRRKI